MRIRGNLVMTEKNNKDIWHKYAIINASKYRERILQCLAKREMTAQELSEECELYLSHVCRSLKDMIELDLIVCLTPNVKRGKIYKLSDTGVKVVEMLSR